MCDVIDGGTPMEAGMSPTKGEENSSLGALMDTEGTPERCRGDAPMHVEGRK